jgi:hypothetical protein
MPTQKFHVGEIVHLSASVTRNVPGGSYEVVKSLPASSGEVPDLHQQCRNAAHIGGSD